MRFRVVEQFVEPKSYDRVCEDIVVVSYDFVAVIDGASDATGAQFDDKSGGRFAAESLARTIASLPADADARAFADRAASSLATDVAAVAGVLDADTRWPVAVLTCASAHRREVWRIGDGNVVIDGIEHPATRRIDRAAYGFRAAVNAALLAKGTPVADVIEDDPGARAARLLIDNQQHLANRVGPWGYGCINGQPVPDEYIEVIPIPTGPTEVVFTSDGYPVASPTLLEAETVLTQMIRDDPVAIGELWAMGKSTKPGANAPDDRSYLRFTMQS